MKLLYCVLFIFSCIFFLTSVTFCKSFLINRVDGQVYDQSRNPVDDVYVELLDAVDSTLARTKTNSSGHFTFIGLPSGRFTIKILPLSKGFLEDSQEIEINNQISKSDTVYVEFYLRPDRRKSIILQEGTPEAIFVQEIPKEAQKLYEIGSKDLDKTATQGTAKIEEALKIFPDYFDALYTLGTFYSSKKDYAKSYAYLLKAIDVNPRSYRSYYSLGYAFYQLNEIPAALKATEACIVLNAGSPSIQLLYGTLLRINKDYKKAETALIKSDSLSKSLNPEVHWQLALLYNKLNRNKEAADQLEIYLKLYPDSPDKKNIQDLIAKLKSAK